MSDGACIHGHDVEVSACPWCTVIAALHQGTCLLEDICGHTRALLEFAGSQRAEETPHMDDAKTPPPVYVYTLSDLITDIENSIKQDEAKGIPVNAFVLQLERSLRHVLSNKGQGK